MPISYFVTLLKFFKKLFEFLLGAGLRMRDTCRLMANSAGDLRIHLTQPPIPLINRSSEKVGLQVTQLREYGAGIFKPSSLYANSAGRKGE